MSYDHRRYAGNEGDLIKHAVLAACITRLRDSGAKDGPFHYVETHAGWARHSLSPGGSWQHGVGRYSSLPKVVANRKLMEIVTKAESDLDSEPLLSDALCMYDDVAINQPFVEGMEYPGSSLQVFRLFEHFLPQASFELWENDLEAFSDLLRQFGAYDYVSLHKADGLEGVARLEKAGLVMIDPPGIDLEDQDRLVHALSFLEQREIPFLCWTARLADMNSSDAESYRSLRFLQAVAERGWAPIRVGWPARAGRTIGCQLTVSRKLQGLVRKTAREVAVLMDWRVER